MRKINSIGYGGKILGCAAVFTLVIPGVVRAIVFFRKSRMLAGCAKVSFGIGILLILFLLGLLAVELYQDKRMNLYYETRKNQKLDLKNGLNECQACGNRKVQSKDRHCGVCGIVFKGKGE